MEVVEGLTAAPDGVGVASWATPGAPPLPLATYHEGRDASRCPGGRETPGGPTQRYQRGYKRTKPRGRPPGLAPPVGRLFAAGDVEFGEDVAHVHLHGFEADPEFERDLRVGEPAGEPFEDLTLAGGEAGIVGHSPIVAPEEAGKNPI